MDDYPHSASKRHAASGYFHSVLSRDQLLHSEAAYFKNLEQNIMRLRRTKIICTVTEKTFDYENLKMMYLAGMNVLRLNMAYASHEDLVAVLANKNRLEKDLSCFIPLILDLKGSTLRIGRLGSTVLLKKGQEFRFSTDQHIIGDENIVAIDENEDLENIQPGDKLMIDYGQISFTVIKREKLSETLRHLRTLEPERYESGFQRNDKPKVLPEEAKGSAHDLNKLESEGAEEEHQRLRKASGKSISSSGSFNNLAALGEKPNKYKDALLKEKQRQKEKTTIVCQVDMDCMLHSRKPIFIYSTQEMAGRSSGKDTFEMIVDDAQEDDEETTILTPKDIKDINIALKMETDCIAVSDVRSAKDILEVKHLLGNRRNEIRILAKLQNRESIQNYTEIISAADGIMISRNYLGLHMPVETLYLKEREIIEKCHELYKPVFIVGQILDNMITSCIPKFNEIHDIANLITAGADGLTLVSECTIGHFVKESIETLSRICVEVESKIKMDILKAVEPSKKMIAMTIAKCCVDAVKAVNASLLICFTQTGSTALQLSKLKPTCPILAIVKSENIARRVNFLSSVIAIKFGALFGGEGLIERALTYAREKGLVRSGEYVVATIGGTEGVSGQTNGMKILQVESANA
eukprot:TRINITY_DN5698_c0_g1_i1.p1 TRINITY_DN5698_c0_g1~~TRINITY_DN5698_c0_g1_i1.p1  ORF type:complete len:637 (+),score=138.79 TRINITY_DN5698_c0_g1_i1:33-1943(+)